ncbi:twin-arginine translocase subunit TatC [Halomarina salina]|uniref:Sec-independent protein translocase protein TatC n=1 Tax=Halomarina salina TaxID=1872699 RepID=A0ABD5RM04_9EURY
MSSAIDDDTKRAFLDGRAAVGEMLRATQKHLQKVALVFLFGLLGTILYLYYYGWDMLKADLLARAPDANIIAVTPFDVILLQAKIGLIIGAILSLPLFVYYGRDALRRRGLWPDHPIPVWQVAGMAVVSVVLFLLGIAYGYYVFFPVMFEFLSSNAAQAGFSPDYSIVKWAEFVLFLTLSFGLAAQLPLAMASLAYGELVRYETFRDKWRYAVVAIFAFGAVFSPPDPFTQIMWAIPLLFLYAFSLGMTKIVVSVKRSGDAVGLRAIARSNWNTLLGGALLGGLVTYGALAANGIERANRALTNLPAEYRVQLATPGELFGVAPETGVLVAAAIVALVVAVAVYVVHLFRVVDQLAVDDPGAFGDPAAIDVRTLDAAGVRAAPPEAFAEMDEEEALSVAGEAMDDGDHEKAQAVLDRYDEAEEARAEAAEAAGEGADEAETADGQSGEAAEEDESGLFTRTTTGMVDSFTEEETTEDDVGGYIYDVQFILGSLASKSFRLIAIFMLAMGGSFAWLYSGGIGDLQRVFLRNLPTAGYVEFPLVGADPITGGAGSLSPGYVVRLTESVSPEAFELVTLHPVEALIFEVKLSMIIGAVAVLPLLLYYMWPALSERGFVSGNRGVLFTWAVTTAIAIAVGSVLGFLVVAPNVISWLAADIVNNGMLIKYRINSFGWLVFFTTVGVGLLAAIPTTMLLFHRGGIAPFHLQRDRWREAVTAVFALAAFLTPRGLFTMFLIAVPVALMYGVGLGVLWVFTLGGRRTPRSTGPRAD